MNTNRLFKSLVATMVCVLSLSFVQATRAQDCPINNGMSYFQYESYGGPSFTQNNNGNYSASWSSFGGDFTTGTGWSTWYNNLPSAPWPWVQVGYNAGACTISGFGSFGCYGWFTHKSAGYPDTEFYIVEMSGGFPLTLQGGPIGTVTTDGGTYKIYHNYFPNQLGISQTAPLEQWISIRQGNNSVGANHYVSTFNHFNAWQSLGWNMGNFDYMDMSTEGGEGGSGYVNASAWLN